MPLVPGLNRVSAVLASVLMLYGKEYGTGGLQSIIISRTNKNKNKRSPLAGQKLGYDTKPWHSDPFSKLARALHCINTPAMHPHMARLSIVLHNIGKASKCGYPHSHPIPSHPIPSSGCQKVPSSFLPPLRFSLPPSPRSGAAQYSTTVLVPCHVIRLAPHGGFKLRFASLHPFSPALGKFCIALLSCTGTLLFPLRLRDGFFWLQFALLYGTVMRLRMLPAAFVGD